MQPLTMRNAPEKNLGADITLATAFFCGFIFFLFIPLHGLLRVFTENIVLVSWKDVVLGVGMVAAILYGFKKTGVNVWSVLAVTVLVMLCYIALGSAGADLLVVADGTISKFGPICVAAFFWVVFSKAVESGRTPTSLLLVLSVSAFAAIWVIAEDRFGLTVITTSDENLQLFARQGIVRARAFFDSPMDAGQWLWFSMVIAITCRACESRSPIRAGLMVCALLALAGILFTGSRGPYGLVAGSLLLFVAISAAFGRIKVSIATAAAIAIGLLLVAPLLLSAVLQDNAAAIREIAESVTDRDEGANVIREERWSAGWEVVSENPLGGMGIENISHKHLAGTGNIFENTFLDFGAALGFVGLIYVVIWYWVATKMASTYVVKAAQVATPSALLIGICLWVPWAAYGFVYPTLNTRIGAAVSWAILGCAVAGFEARKQSLLTTNTH